MPAYNLISYTCSDIGLDHSGTSASSLSSAQSLPGWVMDAKDIEILRFENGKPFLLGTGSFGTVYKALRQGVQSVAVKQITQADEWQMGQFIKVTTVAICPFFW